MLTQDSVIVDARSGPKAREKYAAAHIDGALFVDLETQLANIPEDPSKGGRHPLPDPAVFAEVLTALGINPHTHVVVYDDKSGANAAARFWWMLKALGHKKVQVLDGGLEAAERSGVPISDKKETADLSDPYPVKAWGLPLASIADVDEARQDSRFLVIDVREEERYLGKKEPIDQVAGHIPGSVNAPFSDNLDPDGSFRDPSLLNKDYGEILEDRKQEEVIVHCGSGVTACHTLLAMAHAGMAIPRLYVGSWSEWSRNNRPVATDKRE